MVQTLIQLLGKEQRWSSQRWVSSVGCDRELRQADTHIKLTPGELSWALLLVGTRQV